MKAPQGVRIRQATVRDLDLLAELFTCFVEEQAQWGPSFEAAAGPQLEYRNLFEHSLALAKEGAECIWLAENDTGSPIAFLLAHFSERPAFFRERRRCTIEDAWVRPEDRRCGVGRALVEAAMVWGRRKGAQRMVLQVAQRNEQGRAFWQRMGFATFMDVMGRDL